MSRKMLVILSVFVFGAFTAPMAMALSIADVGTSTAVPAEGSTAGTILNPEGKGDALIFPYYDVRLINGKTQDNYFAIINDSGFNDDGTDVASHGYAAKLRFREWDKSLEVYDINIWLSCNDVWIGLITQDTTQQLAQLWSPDWVIVGSSDTSFSLQTALNVTDAAGNLIGRPFRPSLIPIPNNRTLLGYFEVIGEEATICKATGVTGTGPNKIGTVARIGTTTHPDAPNFLEAYFYIVRVSDGVAAGYNATALANFSRTQGSLYFPPESIHPHLGDCEDTIDQVEFMLSKRYLSQGFSIESGINANFSAIITFPTKHFHFAGPTTFALNSNANTYTVGLASPTTGAPFNGATTINPTANTGEEILVAIWDRNENPFRVPPGFESPTSGQSKILLKYEVNVVGLYNTTGAVGTLKERDNLGLPSGGFDSGWFKIDLNGTAGGQDLNTHIKTLPDGNLKLDSFNWFGNLFDTYHGLPAIGLVYQEFSNAAAGGFYGEILPIFYEVDWRDE